MPEVPVQNHCPHCDSQNVEQMKDRRYEASSTNTWFECLDCKRMWNIPKMAPPALKTPGAEHSPDS